MIINREDTLALLEDLKISLTEEMRILDNINAMLVSMTYKKEQLTKVCEAKQLLITILKEIDSDLLS